VPDELSWYLQPPESSAPAYRCPASAVDPFAVAAAATGGFPVCPPLGIVFGALALQRLRRSGRRGHALAQAGFVGGVVWTGAAVLSETSLRIVLLGFVLNCHE